MRAAAAWAIIAAICVVVGLRAFTPTATGTRSATEVGELRRQHDLAPLSGHAGLFTPAVEYSVPPPTGGEGAGKTVVITGGAGFIGSQLGHRLHRKGYRVVLIDNMRFGYRDNLVVDGQRFGTFVRGDVLDPRVRRYFAGADAVFHFAALSALPVCQSHARDALDVNVAGAAAALEAAREHGVRRFIFASTSATYERNTEDVLTEDLAVRPRLLYSLSKAQGEAVVRSYGELYGQDFAILRFFNVYGPHQDVRRVSPPFTSYLARELTARRVPVLHGDGEQRRDYVHVEDVMRLAELAMTRREASGETFNAASGETHSVKEIFNMAASAAGWTPQPVFHSAERFWDAYPSLFAGARPIQKQVLIDEVTKRTRGSFEKARRLLGWTPSIAMADGMTELVRYVERLRREKGNLNEAPTAWKA